MRTDLRIILLAAAAIAAGAVPSAARPALAEAPGAAAAEKPLKVFVTILPQAWFVERIAGPYAEVHVLVGPGQSPHTFDATPQQMAQLSEARLFFASGWPFERRLLEKAKAVNPGLQVIDTRQGIPLRWMKAAEAEAGERAEQAAPDGVRSLDGAGLQTPSSAAARGGTPDPHFWLNPRYAKIMAATIEKALDAADPPHAEAFRKNLATLDDGLDKLDARLREALAPLAGRDFFVYHPAFGYFADAYGLRQAPVELEGKEPTARQLARLIARARAGGVRVIFVQPQFSAKSAEAVAAAIGGAVVPLDDLAKDYIANLTDMAEKVSRALAAGNRPAAQKK
jgi:zinc transport system substrate-binding protein